MKIFEVTAAGFYGGTDKTDNLVYWIRAETAGDVENAIQDTGAKFWGEIDVLAEDHDSTIDFDFSIAGQAMLLCVALLQHASDLRNKERAA